MAPRSTSVALGIPKGPVTQTRLLLIHETFPLCPVTNSTICCAFCTGTYGSITQWDGEASIPSLSCKMEKQRFSSSQCYVTEQETGKCMKQSLVTE